MERRHRVAGAGPTAYRVIESVGGPPVVYVCMCRAVSHTTVLAVIEAGARTVVEISEQSRAATACGKCRENLVHLLAVAKAQDEEP